MHFQLAKSYKDVKMNRYNQPYFTAEQKDLYEEYWFSWEEALIMAEDFCYVYEIQKDTELLLDIGDIDYADTDTCKIIKPRIEERLKKPITPRLKEMYTVLLDYVSRAIEYNTGVWIDL